MRGRSMRGLLEPYSEPTMRFCRCTSSLIGTETVASVLLNPTATSVPAGRRHSTACRIVSGRPTASITHGAPPLESSRTRSTTSDSLASTTCAAPTRRASSSLTGSMSIAITGWAPVSAAPMTAARPTPPVPKTASGSPAGRRTTLTTAPTPVITAHAEIAAIIGLVQAGLPVHQPVGRCEHPAEAAEDRVARHARLALAAAGPPEQSHPVTDRHAVTGPRTDGLDDASTLMAHHEGELRLQVARHVVQVAVAHTGGLDTDQDLPCLRLVELDILEPQRRTDLAQHRRPHRASMFSQPLRQTPRRSSGSPSGPRNDDPEVRIVGVLTIIRLLSQESFRGTDGDVSHSQRTDQRWPSRALRAPWTPDPSLEAWCPWNS